MNDATDCLNDPLPEFTLPYPVSRFSVEKYHEMIATGVLTEEDNVELLEGWIVPMMRRNPPHEVAMELVGDHLRSLLIKGWRLRDQLAITTSDSQPEPDFAIVRGSARDNLTHHPLPAEVAMVVEVSDSSLSRDRNKRRLYARAEVPVYWLLNLNARQLEVYTRPSGPTEAPAYAEQAIYRAGDEAPLVVDGQTLGAIKLDDILP
ncbi:hypothetical protein Pla175_07230 [Pirellulimonas nuda]|uniref:Putative restriction endonuclease domain-containing protein n=1 Tax=Pirellulimonas nuda TaxID=2528009 RepID=A0A518D7A2_9BACT|nr:Uma2 family endonuclease [Pirellulimonas nuda]QDU87364.1 hypothetical protein Pla175_07230 [Pirellulimonas nuda]